MKPCRIGSSGTFALALGLDDLGRARLAPAS